MLYSCLQIYESCLWPFEWRCEVLMECGIRVWMSPRRCFVTKMNIQTRSCQAARFLPEQALNTHVFLWTGTAQWDYFTRKKKSDAGEVFLLTNTWLLFKINYAEWLNPFTTVRGKQFHWFAELKGVIESFFFFLRKKNPSVGSQQNKNSHRAACTEEASSENTDRNTEMKARGGGTPEPRLCVS